MKATINGFRYDTGKANLIGEASHGRRGDFTHWSAGLYKTTRSGRFYLAGSGGPMSRWGRRGWSQNGADVEGIIPLDAEEALAWAAQYLTPAEIKAAFDETTPSTEEDKNGLDDVKALRGAAPRRRAGR